MKKLALLAASALLFVGVNLIAAESKEAPADGGAKCGAPAADAGAKCGAPAPDAGAKCGAAK